MRHSIGRVLCDRKLLRTSLTLAAMVSSGVCSKGGIMDMMMFVFLKFLSFIPSSFSIVSDGCVLIRNVQCDSSASEER